jgi:hypothetical protein
VSFQSHRQRSMSMGVAEWWASSNHNPLVLPKAINRPSCRPRTHSSHPF